MEVYTMNQKQVNKDRKQEAETTVLEVAIRLKGTKFLEGT